MTSERLPPIELLSADERAALRDLLEERRVAAQEAADAAEAERVSIVEAARRAAAIETAVEEKRTRCAELRAFNLSEFPELHVPPDYSRGDKSGPAVRARAIRDARVAEIYASAEYRAHREEFEKEVVRLDDAVKAARSS